MNYKQARQIGSAGPAPGKWNWSNANDSIAPNPYTVAPCAWPDFEWPPFAGLPTVKVTPTGRERCDHDTQEEAERHHYEYNTGRVRIGELDISAARQRSRCDVVGCPNWETHHARWPGGYLADSLCADHATMESVRALHPFVSGMREIHS